jgi:hypothetical protein
MRILQSVGTEAPNKKLETMEITRIWSRIILFIIFQLFLISNFRHVLNVVFFLLGDPGVWILCADVSEHSVPSSSVVWTRDL